MRTRFGIGTICLLALAAASTSKLLAADGYYKVTPQFRLDGSFYTVPEESATGPYPNLYNQSLGSITTSNGLTGALFGFNWAF